MNKILTMLKLQQALNDATNGIGWEKGITDKGKRIDWRRCALLEAAEMIDSYPWKHWKDINAMPDRDNIRIEAVDIWHFVLSEMLRIGKLKGLDHHFIALLIEATDAYKRIAKGKKRGFTSHYDEIEAIEDFIATLFEENLTIEKLFEEYVKLTEVADLNLDQLYALYVGKNILNRFRQDHGYKEGTYTKVWGGKEDNVVMQSILQCKPDITPDELYRELQERYHTIAPSS